MDFIPVIRNLRALNRAKKAKGLEPDTYFVPKGELVLELRDSTDSLIFEKREKLTISSAVSWEKLVSDLEIKEDGNLKIYIDNSSSDKVYFDEFIIERTEATIAVVVQENHYYPFGMNMKGIEELDIQSIDGKDEHRWQYNGKEKEESFGLYWNDHGARNVDLQLGRWWGVDPLAEKYISSSSYTAMLNNPIRFVDLDGMQIKDEVSGYYYSEGNKKSTMKFILSHPIAAITIGTPQRGVTNISTNAVRFSTRIGLNENDAHEGSQVNAFRHTLWQATISSEFGTEVAKEVGDAHESDASAATGSNFRTLFNTSSEADQTVDLMNNEIGRSIGAKNEGANMQELALKTLESYKESGLWTSTSIFNKEGKVVGYNISKQKLSKEQYEAAKKIILGLNADGFTQKEQDKRDEYINKGRNILGSKL